MFALLVTHSTLVNKKLLILVDVSTSSRSVLAVCVAVASKITWQKNEQRKGSLWSLFCFCALTVGVSPLALGGNDCQLSAARLQALPLVEVRQVFDGDTVLLKDGRKVRFIGVNTPEKAREDRAAEPLAKEATEKLVAWQGRSIRLMVGKESRDRYGRLLAHPFDVDGVNITATLLQEGLGFPVAIPPNVDFASCYQAVADRARNQGLGVWGHSYYVVRPTSSKAGPKGGFGLYRGKIEKIYVSKKVIWIDLFGDVSLRVAKKDYPHIEGVVLKRLLAAVDDQSVLRLPPIEFSGWLMDRMRWGKKMARKVESGKRKRWQMNIRHRNHWTLSNP